jgi:hypothetical protein
LGARSGTHCTSAADPTLGMRTSSCTSWRCSPVWSCFRLACRRPFETNDEGSSSLDEVGCGQSLAESGVNTSWRPAGGQGIDWLRWPRPPTTAGCCLNRSGTRIRPRVSQASSPRPTFSATPLDWRHAQLIRLAWSISAGDPRGAARGRGLPLRPELSVASAYAAEARNARWAGAGPLAHNRPAATGRD